MCCFKSDSGVPNIVSAIKRASFEFTILPWQAWFAGAFLSGQIQEQIREGNITNNYDSNVRLASFGGAFPFNAMAHSYGDA